MEDTTARDCARALVLAIDRLNETIADEALKGRQLAIAMMRLALTEDQQDELDELAVDLLT